MLSSINLNAKDLDPSKQMAVMRNYLNNLKDEIEGELNNIRYDMLDADLRGRIDDITSTLLQNQYRTDSVAEILKSKYITAQEISAQYVTTNYLTANYITASQISASYASFGWVQALDAMVGNLNAKAITTDNLSAQSISAGQITSGTLSASRISAGSLNVNKLASSDGTIQTAQWVVSNLFQSISFNTSNRTCTVRYAQAAVLVGSTIPAKTATMDY